MKKGIIKLVLFVLLLLPISVKASESITIDCALEEAKPGDEVICNVDGSTDTDGIKDLKANLVLSDGLHLKDQRDDGDDEAKYIVLKNSWQGDSDLNRNPENPDINIAVYRSNPTSSSFSIFTMIVVVDDDASVGNKTVTINNVSYYSGTEKIEVSSASETISVVQDEESEETPDLRELYVTSGGVMSPIFSTDNTTYAIRLDSADTTKFNITAVAEDDKYSVSAKNTDTGSTIDLNKDITFSPSEDSKTMSIKITVSHGGYSKEYTLIVDRPKPTAVGEPTLASLIVGGVSVKLQSGVYDYQVPLNKDILKSYKIFATLSDDGNFKFTDYTKSILDTEKSDSYPFEIQIIPKDSDSGYGSSTYIITIVTEDGGKDSVTDNGSNTGNTGNTGNVTNSPKTGQSSGIIMGIVLIMSFAGSIYYYKKNISEYE